MPKRAQSIAEFQRKEKERRRILRGEAPPENAIKAALQRAPAGKKESILESFKRGIGAEIKEDVSGAIKKTKNFLAELLKKGAAAAEAKNKRKAAAKRQKNMGK